MVLSIQPEVYKEEGKRERERSVCYEGGHGWGDVIDLTGPMSPEERERFR